MRRFPAVDVLLAVLALAATVPAAGLALRYGSWPYVLNTVLSMGLAAALLVRRRHVVGSAVATFGLLAAMAALVWLSPVAVGVSPLLVCAPLSVVALTRYARSHRAGVLGAVVGVLGSPLSPAVELATRGRAPDQALGQAVWMTTVNALVVVVAHLWALRQREIAERHAAELAELHARATTREELAASRERNRIAREVHDVVAHSVALIQVEAATGLAIAESEPEHARTALETIKQVSRGALDEIRALVGVLRQANPQDLSPGASLTGLPAMLSRIGGVRADLPDPDGLAGLDADLDPLARLAVVRVTQEAVTNAVRHGTGPVHVELGRADGTDDHHIRIRVRNAVAGAVTPGTDGFGLLGLRERMAGVGGRIEHRLEPVPGRAGSGERFVVEARVPLRGVTGSPR